MIYLDHAATTPTDPEVLDAMLPFLSSRFGNPSSIHQIGRESRAAVDKARDSLAASIHSDYSEICFTSGGTEADNLAIIGAMLAAPKERNRLVVSAIEHHAVLHSARFLETQGFDVTYLPVDSKGFVELHRVEEAVTERTALVSVMHANNEIGTIQDVKGIAEIAHRAGALYHSDGVQSFGYLDVNVSESSCDMLSLSAHKVYGPKGVGALYVRSGTKLSPILFGGAQERERRGGTENTAGIVGFGRAVELLRPRRNQDSERIGDLRDRFVMSLMAAVPGVRLNGPTGSRRLPNNVNVSFEGIDGSAMLMNLDRAGVAASSGSACSSGSLDPSHVLQAIGLPPDLAASGVRFSFGRSTTVEGVDQAVCIVAEIVRRLRRAPNPV